MNNLAFFGACCTAIAAASRPHVVIVIVDDVGHNDVGWRNPAMQTPFIDSLHEESTDFERLYAYPTCSPSRGALFTGRYAHETGLTFALVGRAVGGVDLSLPTIAHSFAKRGYSSDLIGKWHIGHAKHAHLPTARGFDNFFGLKGGAFNHLTKSTQRGVDLWNSSSNGTTLVDDPKMLDPMYHATEMFTDAAVARIDAQDANKPMFLTLSYTAPHDPLMIDPKKGDEYMARCSGFAVLRRRQFCALLAQVDDGVERVVGALKQKGMWDNTALMFLSDNGGMPYGGGNNEPLRGMKTGVWEGGVRVPGFLRLPESVHKLANLSNTVVAKSFEHPFHITDITPTLLAVSDSAVVAEVGADASARDPTFDGRNMLTALMNQELEQEQEHERSIVLQHDPYTNSSSLLKGNMKLMLGSPGIPWVFEEPTSDYYVTLDGSETSYVKSPLWLRGTVVEALADTADTIKEGTGGPLTLASYVIAMNRIVAVDYVSGTHYRNLLVDKERDLHATSAHTRTSCPSLEVDHVFLYDVVADPSEANNLASTQPELVRAMHGELCDVLQRSDGVIVAGDAEDSAVTMEEAGSPWLADDTDISTLSSVKSRFFVELSVKMNKLVKVAAVVVCLFVCIIFSVGAWSCCRKRRNMKKQKGSANLLIVALQAKSKIP